MKTADKYLTHTAFHEAGHAVVWRKMGFTVSSIKIYSSGVGSHGRVRLKNDLIEDIDKYCFGLLAGEQAGMFANHKYDLGVTAKEEHIGCAGDLDSFNKYCKAHTSMRLAAIRVKARSLVERNWKEIDKLGCVLLRRKGYTME